MAYLIQANKALGFYAFENVAPDTYNIYEAAGEDIPVPSVCPPEQDDPSGFVSTSANLISGVTLTNADITDQNFGDARLPVLTPNNEDVIFPGNVIYYPHVFSTPVEGSVSFAITEGGDPAPTNWEANLFIDTDCSGDFGAVDTPLSGAQSLVEDDELCLLVQVISPFEADATDEHVSTLTATFDYAGTTAPEQILSVMDTTTVLSQGDGVLQLTKLVENLSCQSGGANFPCDYDDGSQSENNNARPGDYLRYSLVFTNIDTESIRGVDLYDVVPAFTALFDPADIGIMGGALPLDSTCDFAGVRGSDFSAAPSVTGCTLLVPAGADNAVGYDGAIQWQLNGELGAGEFGVIVFDVLFE